ncbi:hypothetical protein [Paenibacillus soyae]|uniref:Uncharacterized protein n=1 Tax=Paenibacillus soyae TaxID=2969249 RepID=A0A9X2SBF4_9BACL|nr:hypothetical protein [Paenibacillus soyae]MCR2807619.1 hypothetical protein [Paenibacillus soyae]
MRSFYRLLNYELGTILRGVLLLSLGTVISPLMFLSIHMNRDFARYQRYETILEESGCMIVFLVYLAAMLGLFLKSFYSHYSGSKSIYTLLALPVRREAIYFGKLLTLVIALLMLWAALSLSVWIGFGMVDGKIQNATNGLVVPHNGMFLAVIRSSFLSIAFPLNAQALLSTLSIGTALATGICYGAVCERSRRYWGFAVLAGAAYAVIRALAYRMNLPASAFDEFSLQANSIILLLFSAWFAWHGIRLVKRGAIG